MRKSSAGGENEMETYTREKCESGVSIQQQHSKLRKRATEGKTAY